MSTTFSIEANPTGRFVLAPACHDTIGGTTAFGSADAREFDGTASYATYESALADLVAHKAECDDCAHYGCYTQAVMDVTDAFDVRIAHGNDDMVLAHLGLTGDVAADSTVEKAGAVVAATFIERATFLLASLDTEAGPSDTGIRAAETNAPGRARYIDCGIAAGYLSQTAARLVDLGLEAQRLGRDITWC